MVCTAQRLVQGFFSPDRVRFGVSLGNAAYVARCNENSRRNPHVTILPTSSASDLSPAAAGPGTKDGRGGGDHDQPYTFGRRPRADTPFPFRTEQYGRLLALRGCMADGLFGSDDVDAAGLERSTPTFHTDANASQPSLCYRCDSCGAMVAGAYQSTPIVRCPRCAHESERDRVARAILATAGVLI
jgi:hypothetical protein